MPFSLFAARCLYVATKPLKYRQDVIRRIYTARVGTHATLATVVGGTEIVNVLKTVM